MQHSRKTLYYNNENVILIIKKESKTSGCIMVMRIWGLILLNCNQNLTTEQKVLIIGCTLYFFFFLIWEWNMTQICFFEKHTQDAYIHNSTCIQIKSHKHTHTGTQGNCRLCLVSLEGRCQEETGNLRSAHLTSQITHLSTDRRAETAGGVWEHRLHVCVCVCVCVFAALDLLMSIDIGGTFNVFQQTMI